MSLLFLARGRLVDVFVDLHEVNGLLQGELVNLFARLGLDELSDGAVVLVEDVVQGPE